ncbi:hypothetical protein [Hoylesella loescheii]|nr:hypothetical protein [Hoylesella loescheii]
MQAKNTLRRHNDTPPRTAYPMRNIQYGVCTKQQRYNAEPTCPVYDL